MGVALLEVLCSCLALSLFAGACEAADLLGYQFLATLLSPDCQTAVSLAFPLNSRLVPVTLGQDHISWPPTQQCLAPLETRLSPMGLFIYRTAFVKL